MSTGSPFGSVADDTLVDETALDLGQPELILTGREFDQFHNTVIRRYASELATDSIHGKSPKFQIKSALVRQRTLDEYDEG